MHYLEVAVASLAVRGQSTLTYSSEESLPVGSIVQVEIGKKTANGIVFKEVKKPVYKTKSISSVLYLDAIPLSLISTMNWISKYYETALPHVVTHVLPKGLDKKRSSKKINVPKTNRKPSVHKLTKDQKSALDKLQKSSDTSLLHGVTGSGKTRIYVERAKKIVEQNKGVVVLVPEIGLTSQVLADFKDSFKELFVVHSQLTESARHQIWEKIHQAKTPIVIGARSALFSPIKNLGLIIIDEEHENSYKQDQSPKYHAIRVASYLARQSKAQLILGSATPTVEDYYLAKHTKSPIIELKNTIQKVKPPQIEVIDLKDRDNFTKNSYVLSNQLIESIGRTLNQKQQALIFHNRRGTSTMVVCKNCGWVAECKNCFLPMTHHHDIHKLICHICNWRADAPHTCPKCKQPELLYKGLGTKQIVVELKKQFPGAKIARFDSDLKASEQLASRYDELHSGEIDIIVGTQMIAKGLDLPKLNMVGVVLADTTLYLPDFSANERAFQLLYQVIGRVGRHSDDSEVVIQSYTPEHSAILNSTNRDYDQFYKGEIKQREVLNYPPFTFLLSLKVERASQKSAFEAAEKLAKVILNDVSGVQVLGPTPAFHERTAKGYRWQIVVKAKDRAKLNKIVENLLPDRWQFELDPINLL